MSTRNGNAYANERFTLVKLATFQLQALQRCRGKSVQDHGQRLCQLTPISRRDCGAPLSPFRSLLFGSSAFQPVRKDSRQWFRQWRWPAHGTEPQVYWILGRSVLQWDHKQNKKINKLSLKWPRKHHITWPNSQLLVDFLFWSLQHSLPTLERVSQGGNAEQHRASLYTGDK